VVDEPEEKAECDAYDDTSDDGKVKGRVFTAMDDVSGQPAEAERELSTEKEKCADEEQDSSEDEQRAAEFAEVHPIIMRRRRCGGRGRSVQRWIRRRW